MRSAWLRMRPTVVLFYFYVVLTSKLYIVVLCRKKNCTSRIEPNVDSVVSVFVNVNEHKCKR